MTERKVLYEFQQFVDNHYNDDEAYLNQAVELFKSSESLAINLARSFPKVNELAKHNVSGTLSFLNTKKVLSAYLTSHKFFIDYRGQGEKGFEVWKKYKSEIENYVDKLTSEWERKEGVNDEFKEKLLKMRKNLSSYIHGEYYKKLPLWPDVGKENSETLNLNVSESYDYNDFFHVIWSCVGLVDITDRRPELLVYEAELKGDPIIKILSLDLAKLKRLEISFVADENLLEEAKRCLDSREKKFKWNFLE